MFIICMSIYTLSQFQSRSARWGVLPKYVKYNTFVTFLTVIFFSILSTGQTAALARTLNGSNNVFPCKEVLFGGKNEG